MICHFQEVKKPETPQNSAVGKSTLPDSEQNKTKILHIDLTDDDDDNLYGSNERNDSTIAPVSVQKPTSINTPSSSVSVVSKPTTPPPPPQPQQTSYAQSRKTQRTRSIAVRPKVSMELWANSENWSNSFKCHFNFSRAQFVDWQFETMHMHAIITVELMVEMF